MAKCGNGSLSKIITALCGSLSATTWRRQCSHQSRSAPSPDAWAAEDRLLHQLNSSGRRVWSNHGWRGRCSTASVKSLAQRNPIHCIMYSDGDYPGPWFSAIPFIPNRDINSLAYDLKDEASSRFFSAMNHAFASVNAGRELARRFPHRFLMKEALPFRSCGIESGGIKPTDRQQDFQRHISAGCLDEPIAVEPVVEPCFDPLGCRPVIRR
jgi:hypothetical protein